MIIDVVDPHLQSIWSGPVEGAAGNDVVAVVTDHACTEAVDALEDVEDPVRVDGVRDGEDDVGAAVLRTPEDCVAGSAGSKVAWVDGAAGQKAKSYASVGGEYLCSRGLCLRPSYGVGGVAAGWLTETPGGYVGVDDWDRCNGNDELEQEDPEDLESLHCRAGIV